MKNTKYNLLFIGQVYPTIHGASVAAKHLVEGFQENSAIKIYLLNTRFNTSIRTIEKFSLIKVLKLLWYFLKLFYYLVFKNISSVIVMHSFIWNSFYKDTLFIRLCLLFNTNIILYAQSIGFKELFYDKIDEKKRKYVNKIMLRAKKIVVVSEIMKKEYGLWFDKNNIYKIYNINSPILDFCEIRNYNTDKVNLLFLSIICEMKGIFLLLEVFKELVQKYNNLYLIVCGSFWDNGKEEEKSFFDFIKKNSLEDKLDLRGLVNGSEKKKAFLDADIFVLPTLRESFGIVNIEAMSAGLPVISTYQGAIPEYIADSMNGFLTESGNKTQLQEKIEILIKNRELRLMMGQKNREDFKRKFSFEIFLEAWEKVIYSDNKSYNSSI